VVSSSTGGSRRWLGGRPGSSTQVLASWRKKQRGFFAHSPLNFGKIEKIFKTAHIWQDFVKQTYSKVMKLTRDFSVI
jgi:hypothetical protein